MYNVVKYCFEALLIPILHYAFTFERVNLVAERFYLYDETEETKTRFVSFMGENQRFDLAIMATSRYYGKQIVLDMQSNRLAIIGKDDLEEPGYLEYAFNLNENDAEDLRNYLYEVIG